ncbi:MAG: biopolymer transporter ExbD [Muribaculaceae bacterium]|nr:biopolymer transporter ExbD [Muribaculaceae bacterium]MDE6835568.1 biopolymer transporter ExbD [Muribaculaceae bacterium]
MALKRNFQSLDTFSMSSMTDVIFLLLIFFMVTSTIIFPSAIDVNLPQSSEQSSDKPLTEVYIDADSKYYIVVDRNDSVDITNTAPREVELEQLRAELSAIHAADSTRGVALYADSLVDYGKVVDILDMAARNNMRMVLATKAKSLN